MDRSEPSVFLDLLGDWMTAAGPLHQRLADAVAGAVRRGDLAVGDRLPAERGLAAAAAVSRATVVAAYDLLRDQGLVVSRRGSGTRVAPGLGRRRDDEASATGSAGSVFARITRPGDVLSMTRAVDAGTPVLPAVVEAVVREDLPHLLGDLGYHPHGLAELRSAIADLHTREGLPTDPDQVVVTTGAHQAVILCARGLLRPGATVVVESPGWPGSHDVFAATGARVVGVPVDRDGILPEHLARAVAEHEPAAVFLMPTFHNPTGHLMSSARRRQVADLAHRHGLVVVEDLANDVPIAVAPDQVPLPVAAHSRAPADVVTIRSLTKVAWGGLRVGWLRADAETARRLADRKAREDLGTPLIEQAVALRLVGVLPDLVAERSASARDRLAHLESELAAHLPDWTWTPPRGGSALWTRLPGVDTSVFAQVALRHGVEVLPGRILDPSGGHDDHLRLPLTFPAPVLTEVVARLAAAWGALR